MSSHRVFYLLSSLLSSVHILAMSLVLVLVSSSARAQVIADFNDISSGTLLNQAGGTGFTGNWNAGTGVVQAVSGDLFGPSGTAYGIFQTGNARSVQSVHASASRRQARTIDPAALPSTTDPVWFSFLVSNTTAGQAAGIDFNNAGTSTALAVDQRILLSGTNLFVGGTTGATVDVSSKYSLGQTGLIVGKLSTGGIGDPEALDLWFNPNLAGGQSGLLATTPDFTQSDLMWNIDAITILGLQSVIDPGFNGGIIDNVRLSNSITAFVDVVGNPLVNAEWNVNASGNWGTASNWTTVSPSGGLDVIFGSAITSSRTVTMDVAATAGQITFNNASASYNVAPGAGSLAIAGGVTATSGSHTISTNYLAGATENTFNADSGATLNLTGTATANNSGSVTFVLDGAGNGTIGAIRDNNNVGNPLDGTDNVSVVKRGTGSWTIGSGTTTLEDFHGGNTTVEAGTLKVKANSLGGTNGELRSPQIAVNAGATFDTSQFSTYTLGVGQSLRGAGTVNTGTGTLQVFSDNIVAPGDSVGTLTVNGNLTLNAFEGSSPTGGFQFELSPSTASGNDKVVVNGNITSNAGGSGNKTGIVLAPTGVSLDTGSYELFTFTGSHTGTAADYTVAGITTRYTLGISVDSDSVNLDVSGSNANLVWRGNNGSNPTLWDLNSTNNWSNGGSPDVFFDLDNVTFDDTAVGTVVEKQGDLKPAVVNFNNTSKNFTVSGPGAIAGVTSVNKSGSGRVTFSNANSYSGTTNITGGVLHAAHPAALGSTAGVTIVNGGALDMTGANIAGEVVHIQGAGSDGRGALMTDGLDSVAAGTQHITAVVQDGDATIAAYYDGVSPVFTANNYRWDMKPSANLSTSWQGNGHELTKKGRGVVSIDGVGEMNLGTVNIDQGILELRGSSTSTGSTFNVGNGTPMQDPQTFTGNPSLNFLINSQFSSGVPTGNMHQMNVVLNGGRLTNQSPDVPVLALTGSIQSQDVTGDAEVDNIITSNTTTSIVNGITGTGGVAFNSSVAAATQLQGNNTYTGNTLIEGNVALIGTGRISGSPKIDVTGSLDVTGRTDGTMTLIGNQKLNLNDIGTVTGNITATGSSVVTAASSNSVNGNVTIASGSRMVASNVPSGLNAGTMTGNVAIQSGGTLQVDTGLGASQIIPSGFLQNGGLTIGGHRYLAFEAESYTQFNTVVGATNSWTVQAVVDSASVPALGGNALVSTGVTNNPIGNDDTVQYDMVFTEPGTYYWYLRTAGPAGGRTFYGPSQDADSSTPSVAPGGGKSKFGVSDDLKDAEGANGITTTWDWVRSDPDGATQGPTVDFEKIIVTQEDVDVGRLFSLQFEGRTVGVQLDKMVLADTFNFTDIDDTLLDGAMSLTPGVINIPAPFFTFNIDGDLSLNAGSSMEIDLRAIDDFDNLSVTGMANLFGNLSINLDSYTPNVNDTFTILSAMGGINDTGLSISSGFSKSIVGNDLVLTFTGAGQPGDFDGDGDVDGRDFLVWQRNPGVGSLADWQNNYGFPPLTAAGTAVPEPSSLVLLTIACLGLLRRQRNQSC